MKRLPGYDCGTCRAELAAFAGLGLAGLALMGAAVSASFNFADERERIVSELTRPVSVGPQVAGVATNHPLVPRTRGGRMLIREGATGDAAQPM